ncbi:multidrug transporter [Shewanella sp. Scap07]|uniref:multidrug transporter n=1 Tax=Shewanella sp. Scap07 TaxID=2589987 RepID=UPI0015BB0BC8|nr:multidrug transporter [Shewanella sp. Scap07]QLE86435.1 multidrug transporter [Shewanella sp. Scap07]
MWIGFTLLAAFMQAWRNVFQSQLSQQMSVAGVTLARFIWAGPLVAVYLVALHQVQPSALPDFTHDFNADFWRLIGAAALLQITATVLMVTLFKMRDYAIGAGLAKSEALVAALLGVWFFSAEMSLMGWLGVIIGAVAILMMSCPNGSRLSVATAGIGLLCGSAFALTSLCAREASLSLPFGYMHSAAWVLLWVILLQTVLLLGFIALSDRGLLVRILKPSKLVFTISLTSCLGSIGWFSAMALQDVALVKTFGQVEVFITLLIARFYLKSSTKLYDILALILIAIAAILVIWG